MISKAFLEAILDKAMRECVVAGVACSTGPSRRCINETEEAPMKAYAEMLGYRYARTGPS